MGFRKIFLILFLLCCLAGGASAESAYIANQNANTVSVIDIATNTITATINVGTQPFGIVESYDGTRAYVANNGTNNVSVIDTSTNTVTASIDVGTQPRGLDISPDDKWLYVANYGDNTVSKINTSSGTVESTINVGTQPLGVRAHNSKIYVTNYGSSNVSVINFITGAVTSITVGSNPYGIGAYGNRVYVGCYGNYRMYTINSTTDTAIANVSTGSVIHGVAVNRAGTEVYISNYITSGTVSVVDPSSNTITHTITVGNKPSGMSFSSDGQYAYVANTGGNTVSVVNTSNYSVAKSITGLNYPISLGRFITPSSLTSPTADFSTNVSNGLSPLTVQFTDDSTGTPTSWLWIFGDGETSTLQNPVHEYELGGDYTVTLTATNGNWSDVKTGAINVTQSQLPVAGFSSNVSSGNAPLDVGFTDSSDYTTSWSWNFGDGLTSTSQNPVHTYNKIGNHTVTLTATNENGTNITTSYVDVSFNDGRESILIPGNESTVSYNGTIVTVDKITLKNGWNPANLWWGTSGGALPALDDVEDIFSVRFTSPANRTVNEVGVVNFYAIDSPTYRIGLQLDDGSGNPDGNYINNSYGLITPIHGTDSDQIVNASITPVDITKGRVYYVVVSYDSGTIAPETNFANFKGMTNGQGVNVGYIPINYGGYDQDVAYPDLEYNNRIYSGYWLTHSRNSPSFELGFTNGDHFGNLAVHNYQSISGLEQHGEKIIIKNQNKTVDAIKAYFWHESATDIPTNDKLYYEIQDVNHTILRNGTLIDDPIEFNATASLAKWYEKNLSSPLNMELGHTYYVIFKSPGSNGSAYYGHDGSGPLYMDETWVTNVTYGGSSNCMVTSTNGGNTWTASTVNDYSYGLHLVNTSNGRATLQTIDAGENTAVSNVSIDGSIPTGTTVNLYVSSSADNTSFSSPALIKTDADTDSVYNIPNSARGRYTQVITELETDNYSISPEIESLTTDNEDMTVTAGFSANPLTGNVSSVSVFTDESSGPVVSYAWDFDNDGDIDSIEQNPAYSYTSSGVYTVNLTVSNGASTDSEVKSDYITVEAEHNPSTLIEWYYYILSHKWW